MKFVWLLCWLSVRIAQSQATSHWMVTETGLIQPRDGSPFLMENPFDLLSFLNQDARWTNIFNLYHNLIYMQKNINKLWKKLESDANFDEHIAENKFCEKVGNIDMIDWYTSFLEDGRFKGIPEKEFSLQRSEYGDVEIPDCKKISSLTYSMFAFEHLDSMINREHLNATPEYILPELFSPIMTVDQFGHWLSNVLCKNTSSWLHYNLAAIYWRVKGNVPKALECSRRAVHYAPRQYKNVALLCLGSILHRSRHSDDAIVVLGAAIDHDPGFPISHFAIGGALAVRGDFNTSLKHLDLSIKLHSKFEFAAKYKNAVMCHVDMFKKMQIARSSIKKLSKALRKYVEVEHQWLKSQIAFLKTMKHEEEYDYKNVEKNCIKMSEITGLKIKELKQDGDRNSIVLYFIDSPTYNVEWVKETGVTALDTAQSLQRIIKHIGKNTGFPTAELIVTDETKNITEPVKEIGPSPSFPEIFFDVNLYKPHLNMGVKTDTKMDKKSEHAKSIDNINKSAPSNIQQGKPDTGKLLYPPNFKVDRNKELFDTDPEWPSPTFCKEFPPTVLDNIEAVYPVFLPFENKGIKLTNLLTERIGVPALAEHELPWHPPICPSDKDLILHTQRKGLKMHLASQKVSAEILRNQLLTYLGDTHLEILKNMQDAEIGQRIQTAIDKKLAAKWVLYTIASLYWRVRGNIPYSLNCLLTASRTVDTRYRDVVFVSLASVFMDMGLLDESLHYAEEAYKITSYEPATNFVLAQILMVKKNHKAQMFHLKQVVRVDGHYLGGLVRNVLNGWSCILKQINQLKGLADQDKPDICAEVEPGVAMVCERDGTNCHISSRHCLGGVQRETSEIVRMLALKDGEIQRAPVPAASVVIFDKYIKDMPSERTNKIAHKKNYDGMMKTVNLMFNGCAQLQGCSEIEPIDTSVEKNDCTYQQLQLDYWLHFISFRQQISDTDMRLTTEITSLQPSNKKVPDCRLPPSWASDFYLERMMRVDTNGWEPVLSLMHQFAELFGFYDFSGLGSRIARYIDNRPTSWEGLLAAGWWCGASGRGACAARCLAAAYANTPLRYQQHSMRPLTALLHMQSRSSDAIDIAYLSFYSAPKSKEDAFLVAVSHTYRSEYDEALMMYRYALTFDNKYLPAKACLHIAMCNMLYGDIMKMKANDTPT